MAFNSLHFVAFFPIVVAGYFLLPARARSLWLLAASLYFYGSWSLLLAAEVLGTTVLAYLIGLRIEAAPEKLQKKKLMKVGVLALVANLFVFKYTVFFNETLRATFGWFDVNYPISIIHLVLPLGISFYTFQLIGYLFDISNGAKAERKFSIFALFVVYFPKLVAGPIERGKKLLPQLHVNPGFDYGRVVSGLQLMTWGFFQKVVIADRLAPFVRDVYADPAGRDGVSIALATWMFAFQVYADFSGYTDIALGAARVLGVQLTPNFNRPYFSISIQEFWKRWHISLTSWLTDYVYTPLTRTKAIKLKLYYLILVSLFTTFVLSGLWHGAQWNFVAWGALHGTYLVVAVLTQKVRTKIVQQVGLSRVPEFHRRMRIAVTFGLVCFAYILFQARSLSDAGYMISRLPTGWSTPGAGVQAFVDGRWAELLLGLLGIAVLLAADVLRAKGNISDMLQKRPAWLRWGVYQAGAVAIVLLGAFYDTDQAFIYFQF